MRYRILTASQFGISTFGKRVDKKFGANHQNHAKSNLLTKFFQLMKDLQARKFSAKEFLFTVAAKYEPLQCDELSDEPGEKLLLDVSKYSCLIIVSTI